MFFNSADLFKNTNTKSVMKIALCTVQGKLRVVLCVMLWHVKREVYEVLKWYIIHFVIASVLCAIDMVKVVLDIVVSRS